MATIVSPSPSTHPIHHEHIPFWRQIYGPNSSFIVNWDRFMLLVVAYNILVDSCFLYLPIVRGLVVEIDFKPASNIALMRMIGDSFQLFGILVQLRTAYEGPGSRVFRRTYLVKDSVEILRRYLKSLFILDLISALPLPQAYLWWKFPDLKSSSALVYAVFVNTSIIIYIQTVPRLCLMFPLKAHIIQTSGNIVNHSWLGAIYLLLMYIMLSQYIGGWYYTNYVCRLSECKYLVLLNENNANATYTDWDQLLAKCDMKDEIESGMFSNIHQNRIGSRSFVQRAMYCFSWGLKSLSSMGQTFETSFITGETLSSFVLTICGLVLFAGLIAQMQTSIQSSQTGEEQHIIRVREIEEWIKIHQLPPELKKRVRQTVSSEGIATRRIDEKPIVNMLPSELQCDVRRHFYLDLVSNLPFFANLDKQLVHSFCGYLRTLSSTKGSCLVVEGEPVRQVYFIYSGLLEEMILDSGCSSLREGDVCGTNCLRGCYSHQHQLVIFHHLPRQ